MSSEKPKTENEGPERVGGIPVRSARDEFGPDEMLVCAACCRNTPPNRLKCIYCGASVATRPEDRKRLHPVLKSSDEEQTAFSLIRVFDGRAWSGTQNKMVASMTRNDLSDIEVLTGSVSSVPLARTDSEESITIAAKRLLETGARVEIFHDDVFELAKPQKRLRGLAVEDDERIAFILFNNDEIERIAKGDVSLIVVGIGIENRVEASEKHKRKGDAKVIDTTEVSADEILIDIYARDSQIAFRIQTSGFDFSFLEDRKEMLAVKNLEKTIGFLRGFAPEALFNEDYRVLRSRLNGIWEPSERKNTKSMNRRGFGSYEMKRVVTSSNLEQFTKFSRLQWLTLSAQKENTKGDGN